MELTGRTAGVRFAGMGTTPHARTLARLVALTAVLAATVAAAPDAPPRPAARRTPMEEVRGEVAELRKQVEELRAQVAALRDELAAARRGGNGRAAAANPPGVSRAEIDAALKKNRIVVGMTKDEASKVMDRAKVTLNDTSKTTQLMDGRKVEREEWVLNGNPQDIHRLVFINGVLSNIEAGVAHDE